MNHAFWPVALMFIVCAISVVVGALWDQKKNVDERANTPDSQPATADV